MRERFNFIYMTFFLISKEQNLQSTLFYYSQSPFPKGISILNFFLDGEETRTPTPGVLEDSALPMSYTRIYLHSKVSAISGQP